jgi:hypothetical protein
MSTIHADHTSAEPIRLAGDELRPCSCLECREEVWHWPHGLRTDGKAFTLEIHQHRADRLLSVHDCEPEQSWQAMEDLDDPDWGWIE